MVTRKKVSGTAMPLPAGIAAGVILSTVFTLLLSIILTYMVLNGTMNTQAIGYGAMAIVSSSALLGDLFASIKIKRRKMLVAQLTGGIYFLILLAATALFFDAQYQGIGITCILIFTANTIVGLSALRSNQRTKKHVTKIKSR